jgi:hypothetical protein
MVEFLFNLVLWILFDSSLILFVLECAQALFESWQESGRRPEDRRGLYAPLPPTAPLVPVRVRAHR